MIFVISGPSGCGKSTLVGRVRAELKNMEFSVSHTTREKRETETEGIDYYFVSSREFERMVKEKELVEWAVVHGHYYGTSKKELEKKGQSSDLLLDIDVQGAQQIRAKYKKAVFIFVLPPRFPELKKRLEKRGEDTPHSLQMRLEVAQKEIRSYPQFDYIVINERLEQAVEELKSVVVSQRCRLDVRRPEILPILRSFSGED